MDVQNKTFRPFSRLESTEDLVRTWKTCSKVALDLEDGRRLENLSWRLWSSSLQRHDNGGPSQSTTWAGQLIPSRLVRNSRSVADKLSSDRNRPLKQLTAPSLPRRSAEGAQRNAWQDLSDELAIGTSSGASASRDVSAPRIGIEPERTDVELEMEMALGLRRKPVDTATATRTCSHGLSGIDASLYPGTVQSTDTMRMRKTSTDPRKCEAADLDASLDSFGLEGHRASGWPSAQSAAIGSQDQWLGSTGGTLDPNLSKSKTALPSYAGHSIPFDELLSQFVSMNDVNETLDLDQLIDFGCPLANAVAGGNSTAGIVGACSNPKEGDRDADMSSPENEGEEGDGPSGRRSRPVCCMQRLLSPGSQKRLSGGGGCCSTPAGDRAVKSPLVEAATDKQSEEHGNGAEEGSTNIPQEFGNLGTDFDLFGPTSGTGNISRSSPTNGCLLTSFAAAFPGLQAPSNLSGGGGADDVSVTSSTTAVATASTMDPRFQLLQWLAQQRQAGASANGTHTLQNDSTATVEALNGASSWPASMILPTAGNNDSLAVSPLTASMGDTPREVVTPCADAISTSAPSFGRTGVTRAYASPASHNQVDAKGKRKRSTIDADTRDSHQSLALLSAAAVAASATSSPSEAPAASGTEDTQTVNASSNPHAGQRNQMCFSCGTTSTPLWRRDVQKRVVCNRCGLRKTKKPKRSPGSSGGDDDAEGGAEEVEAPSRAPSRRASVSQNSSVAPRAAEAPHVPRVRTEGVLQCHNCGTTITSLWRKDETTGQRSCNPCGLWLRNHGTPRPLAKRTDVIRRRQRFLEEQVKDEGDGGGNAGNKAGREPEHDVSITRKNAVSRSTSRGRTPASRPSSRAATPQDSASGQQETTMEYPLPSSLWRMQDGISGQHLGSANTSTVVGPSVPLRQQLTPNQRAELAATLPASAVPSSSGQQSMPSPVQGGVLSQEALMQQLQAQMQVHLANALAHFRATGTLPPVGGVSSPALSAALPVSANQHNQPQLSAQSQLAQQALLASMQAQQAASPWTASTATANTPLPSTPMQQESSPASGLSPEASRQLLAAIGQSLGISTPDTALDTFANDVGQTQTQQHPLAFHRQATRAVATPQSAWSSSPVGAESAHYQHSRSSTLDSLRGSGSSFALLGQTVLQGATGVQHTEDSLEAGGGVGTSGSGIGEEERRRGKKRSRVAVEG